MILPPLVVVVDVVVFVVMVGFHLFCARWEVQPQPQQKITHLRERFYCYFCRSSGERRHSSFRVRFGSDWSAARTIVLASPSMLTTSTPMGYDEDSRIIQKHATSPPHPSHPPCQFARRRLCRPTRTERILERKIAVGRFLLRAIIIIRDHDVLVRPNHLDDTREK